MYILANRYPTRHLTVQKLTRSGQIGSELKLTDCHLYNKLKLNLFTIYTKQVFFLISHLFQTILKYINERDCCTTSAKTDHS